jgi:cellulose synthase/poly-beta-1,6-N-acetylglucosamine synthase-like glycosyltransferase
MKAVSRRNPNIFVLLPALNEEKSIGLVTNDIPRDIVKEIVVIDNGSTDNTSEVVREHGASALYESTKGYGHDQRLCQSRDWNPANHILIAVQAGIVSPQRSQRSQRVYQLMAINDQ